MVEQVILTKEEYDSLVAYGQKTFDTIENECNEKYKQFLITLTKNILTSLKDAYKSQIFGSALWDDTVYSKAEKQISEYIEQQEYDKVGPCISRLFYNLMSDYRELEVKHDIIQQMKNDIIKFKQEFNDMPWYIKMTAKV